MPSLPTTSGTAPKDDGITLGPGRLFGERGGWIFSEVADVQHKYSQTRTQLLFLNKDTGEAYTLSLVGRADPEHKIVRVFPHWLRFGEFDFCSPPQPLKQDFDDVITSFLTKLRLSGRWNLDPIPY